MNPKLLFHTVVHLCPKQVLYQLWYRLHKPQYKTFEAPNGVVTKLQTEPIPRYHCLDGEMFTFLNLEHKFAGWNFTDNGMLWAYNQNYFDWLNQEGMTVEDGCKWMDRFIKALPSNKVGLDPYPIALRSINWIKFLWRYPDCATKERLDSLYSQVRLLENKLEYHLLANHLLEDAYALYIVASYFKDEKLLDKAQKLLIAQLKEQILPDGAHYEQSPMYHCILLDRLLDCINMAYGLQLTTYNDQLKVYAIKMLGHLESIVWSDGTFSMLNDAAYGIAPEPRQIFDYARRLGLQWESIPMKECGYCKMKSEHLEAIFDVGNITATYQPGHTHADTFNYELRIDGKPFVVDTGISTYNKTKQRQMERSTMAHNCVVVNGKDSSEVWGGFRVGQRARVKILSQARNEMIAWHNGFSMPCKRRFEMTEQGFAVEDWYDGQAVSYVHLAENADEKRVKVKEALDFEMKPWKYSVKYNQFLEGKVLEIRFKEHCKYIIQ